MNLISREERKISMYCRFCGHKIEEGSRFCAQCGAALSTEQTQNPPASQQANPPAENPTPQPEVPDASQHTEVPPATPNAVSDRNPAQTGPQQPSNSSEPGQPPAGPGKPRLNWLLLGLGALVIVLIVVLIVVLAGRSGGEPRPTAAPSADAAHTEPLQTEALGEEASAPPTADAELETEAVSEPEPVNPEPVIDGYYSAANTLTIGADTYTLRDENLLLCRDGEFITLLEGGFSTYSGLCANGAYLYAMYIEGGVTYLAEINCADYAMNLLLQCPDGAQLAGRVGDNLYFLLPGETEFSGYDLVSFNLETDEQVFLVSGIGYAHSYETGLIARGFATDVSPQALYYVDPEGTCGLLTEQGMDATCYEGRLLYWECNASAENNYIWDTVYLCEMGTDGRQVLLELQGEGASLMLSGMYPTGSVLNYQGNAIWVDYAGGYYIMAPETEEGGLISSFYPDGDTLYGYAYENRGLYEIQLDMDAGRSSAEFLGSAPESSTIVAVADGWAYYAGYGDNTEMGAIMLR